MKVAVNLAFCCEHFKGGDGIGRLDGAAHAEWLEAAVDFYHRLAAAELPAWHGWDLLVSMTGWPGWPAVEAGRERDAYWRILPKTRPITMAANPGHQVGAAWCIRLGLEAAGKLGYHYLIHAAEDVVPGPGVLHQMVTALRPGVATPGLSGDREGSGSEYAGQAWGPDGSQLNCQFFACRVPYLAANFDPTAVPRYGCIERYMAHLLKDRPVYRGDFAYAHTHDHEDWRRRADEALGRGPEGGPG